MFKNKLRLLGMSTLVGAGLLATGPASAYNMRLGDFDVQVDTTVSAGISWLMKDVNKQYLPISNGGPADGSAYGSPLAPTDCTIEYGAYCQELVARPNFDGSINTDDGRLNFDKGDPFSAPIRLTSEIEARSGSITAFARINVWHDIVAMDDGAYNRGGDLSNRGEDNAGQDIELLDAYVAYDGDWGDMPFTIKAGRQVINWGEATFIPGGNSSFNPIDVAALRRPGAEIKEALLPVEALYGSLAITQDLTVEAYIGGWDDYRLEAGGTPNAISDSFTQGTISGNAINQYFVGGGFGSGDKFACGDITSFATGPAYQQVSYGVNTAIRAIDGAVNCDESPNMDVLKNWTVGSAEAERNAAGDTSDINGIENKEGDDYLGIAVRYYAENLNSTEFAFYYQKGDSRLPYISYNSQTSDTKAYSVGSKSSTVGRGVGAAGCAGMYEPTGGKLFNPAYSLVAVKDSKGLLMDAGVQAVADSVAAGLGATLPGYARSATPGLNMGYLTETNCLLSLGQINGAATFGSAFDPLGQQHTGATNIGVAYNVELFAEFPEVETYGMSFNTTLAGWGVQGDFTYRPEVPLQFDTDVLTITGLFNACAFTGVGAFEAVYKSGSTYNNEFGTIGCTDGENYIRGYTKDHDAFTWDIGTTATFTRSNPIVSALRSDLGVFLTEFQGIYIDDIEFERGDTGGLTSAAVGGNPARTNAGGDKGITPLNNVCVGGSDLPLNGILSIDDRTAGAADDPNDDTYKGFCRPTNSSWGIVLMAQLQYNNVFGTPIGLKPTVIYSSGIDGYSPSPIGFWREGQGSTAFSLNADYLGRWNGAISYRTYHGDVHRTKNLDRDVLSLSVSYAY